MFVIYITQFNLRIFCNRIQDDCIRRDFMRSTFEPFLII